MATSGAAPKVQDWLAAGRAGFPRQLEAVAPGFYCAGCFSYQPEADAELRALRGASPPRAELAQASEVKPFDLDTALAALRQAAGERAKPTIDLHQPRPGVQTTSKNLKGLDAAVSALLPPSLYSHQLKAIQAGLSGSDVVIATATASGKSLCYQTLAAQALCNEGATVLYIAPINALLMDQMDAFEKFFTGRREVPQRYEHDVDAYARTLSLGHAKFVLARYDGSVPKRALPGADDIRTQVRARQPRVLLTNPEMLVRALLPRASLEKGDEIKADKSSAAWAYFFRGLRLIVVDELHAFRGVFGAHLANALRRVHRMVDLCGGKARSVRHVACTATIRDPAGTATAVLGSKDIVVVGDADNGAPRYRRRLVPIDTQGEKLESFAARLLPAIAFEGGARTIAFRDNIPAIQALKARLEKKHGRNLIDTYCANNPADEKMDKLHKLRTGGVPCLLSTSALELGIDIGDLNASVLLGYPGSIARSWQMLGRAGRSSSGLLAFVAGGNYLDQYWLEHMDELIGDKAEPEDVVVDPNNVFVVAEHLRGAALDHVIDPKRDKKYFGPAFDDALKELEKREGDLRLEDEVWILRSQGEQRAREISLRSLGQYKVPVYVNHADGRPLLEEESHRAPRRLFPGSVFVWDGKYYQSKTLVIPPEGRAPRAKEKVHAIVAPVDSPAYLTEASTAEETTILTSRAAAKTGEPGAGWGDVQVTAKVVGFYKRPDLVKEIEADSRPDEKPLFCPFRKDSAPPDYVYRTQGAWFELPHEVAGAVPEGIQKAAFRTVAEAMVRATPLLRFASPGDLTASVRLPQEDVVVKSGPPENPSIFVNETVLGGAGLARQVFERRKEVLAQAAKLMLDCSRCGPRRAKTNGCPRCVALLDGSQDRRAALLVIEAWRDELDRPQKAAALPRPRPVADILRELGLADATLVGWGGMGTVWRATREGRDVAVKLVLERGGARTRAQADDALRGEARRLRGLSHPNVLRLRDVHEIADGIALELEWADGGNLGAFVAEKHTDGELIDVWRKVVAAVAYLHGEDVVHRDIKDANVLFMRGEPVVADFGIARDLSVERSTATALGTPNWAPPEQWATGLATSKVSKTMDVWSLGKLLQFMFSMSART